MSKSDSNAEESVGNGTPARPSVLRSIGAASATAAAGAAATGTAAAESPDVDHPLYFSYGRCVRSAEQLEPTVEVNRESSTPSVSDSSGRYPSWHLVLLSSNLGTNI